VSWPISIDGNRFAIRSKPHVGTPGRWPASVRTPGRTRTADGRPQDGLGRQQVPPSGAVRQAALEKRGRAAGDGSQDAPQVPGSGDAQAAI